MTSDPTKPPQIPDSKPTSESEKPKDSAPPAANRPPATLEDLPKGSRILKITLPEK
jgi:hypothetical protein